MIRGRLRWYPLHYTRPGSWADFEDCLNDVESFNREHDPTVNPEGFSKVLRYNFVMEKPTSLVLALFFEPEDAPALTKRCGHIWVAVDDWFENKMLNIMQYQISLPPDHTVPLDDKRALLSDIITWGKSLGAKELRTVAYGDALRRAYRLFYGITNDRNDYVIRKPI